MDLTEPEIVAALGTLEPALALCLEGNDVERELHAKFAKAGFATVREFRLFGRNVEEVEEAL